MIGYNDGSKQAIEKTMKNAKLNNQLILEQARNRSAERGNERIEAQKAAQAQIANFEKLEQDRQVFLQRINRLNA